MPKLPPPPAQRPEKVGLVVGVAADEIAVSGDQLDGGHAVALQAVAPGQPGDAAAQRVADDADVGRGAVQSGQAQVRQPRRHGSPLDAGADPHPPCRHVDPHAGQTRRVDDHGAGERPQRAGIVPRGLSGEPEAAVAGVAHGGGDLPLVTRQRDRLGPLVVENVEGLADGVPVGVAGHDDELEDVDRGGVFGGQHVWLLVRGWAMGPASGAIAPRTSRSPPVTDPRICRPATPKGSLSYDLNLPAARPRG